MLSVHSANEIRVFGFIENIAELMQLADLLITKPGPGTLNEAIAAKIPVFVDNTSHTLYWEKINIDMVCRLGIGEKIEELSILDTLIPRYLRDDETKKKIAHAYSLLPKNSFHKEIEMIIESMWKEPNF